MRLNGKMSKKQPLIIALLAFAGVMSFQNCSKVGVQDISSQSEKIVGNTSDEQVVDNGANDPVTPNASTPNGTSTGSTNQDQPDTSGTAPLPPPSVVGANPPSDPQGDQPPVVSNPPGNPGMPEVGGPIEPPVKVCRKMHELGIVRLDHEMHVVKCLRDSSQKCVVICHKPARSDRHSIVKLVRTEAALKAHLAHGDSLGACKAVSQDDDACESDEVSRPHKKHYGHKDRGHHYDDQGHVCNRRDDHDHMNGAGDDRDDDDDNDAHDQDHRS